MSAAIQTTLTLAFTELPELECHVLSFRGKSALNSLYRLEVTALARTSGVRGKEAGDFFAGEASFRIRDASRSSGAEPGKASAWDATWHGVVTGFRRGGRVGDWTVLEVTIEPYLSRLFGQLQNRIQLDSTSCEIVKDSLLFGGVPADRFRFALDQSRYPKREFVFQHEEDLWAFVSRTLEREGIGLSYDQTGEGDVAVFTDDNTQFPPLLDGGDEIRLDASEVSGLSPEGAAPQLFGFRAEGRVPRASLFLKDYNWENPNRPVEVTVPIAPYGRGEIYLYGENFATEAEGRRLGAVRRDEELCACESFLATSRVPGLMPGLTVEVAGAADDSLDGRYLVTADEVSGSQAGRLAAGLGVELGEADADGEIRHSVSLTRAAVAYRPRRATPRPRIAGSVTAWIDGEGSGEQPETDAYGRYKVLFPLDVSGRGSGKASSWIRMAQPFAGLGYGQHYPLTPGCEVLVTFVDGNPDRPVISGAVPNAETGAVVDSSAPNMAGMGTKGGGSLMFRNEPEKQNVTLSAGSDRGHITLAAGSPTTAAVYADIMNTVTTVNNYTSVFSSSSAVGYQYTIKASDDTIRKIVLVCSALRQALEGVTDAASMRAMTDGDDGDKVDDKQKAVLTNNISALVDYTVAPIQGLIQAIVGAATAPAEAAKLPDSNLLSIVGDSNGSKTTWQSKTPFGANTWTGWLTGFLLLMKPIRDAMPALQTYASTDKAIDNENNASQYGVPDSTRPGYRNAQKKVARGVAATQAITKVAGDIISMGVLLKSLWGADGAQTAKGILIENKDSYVNVLAKGWASLSASGGPVIIESNPDQAGDEMRCNNPLYTPSLDAFEDEATGEVTDPAIPFKERNAVLLHGPLVKAMSDQLSLGAKDLAVVKSPKKIRLVTADTALAVRCTSPGFESARVRALKLAYSRDPAGGISDGVEILATKDGDQVLIQTASSRPVTLRSGANLGLEKCAQLKLDNPDVNLQADSSTSLKMKPGQAVLAASENMSVSLKPDGVTVSQSPDNSLSITAEGGKLGHMTSVSISAAGGQSSIVMDAASLTLKSLSIVNVKTEFIGLG
ncbi:MAG: type VI secretion system tip protein VgrG [Deltaproteobacteria bacterium]|jgi:type VI secretion system VgrG family protein|nr:type VI secretion system tip protein VgrG [Deltaproteobacteria bacterium]